MCGIAGLYNHGALLGGTEPALNHVRTMLSTIVHRGPDADGIWADRGNRCALGHRRLSIIDTSDAGRQPMASADQRWWISFNGEIYNFLELRERLAAVGVHPRGRTDTEILVLGIQQWGTDFLSWLDGMFAFAAFDTVTGELLLARDAFGEKPLYYTELAGGAIAFASELQALEVLPGFDDEVSLDAMAEVLMFQYIGSPRSIYRNVHKLLPGQWMKLSREGKTFGTHFSFNPSPEAAFDRNDDELADELEELLVTSLRRRLISDVPLGAFLSGGVDSSTVCALVRRRLGEPLKTFSMGFEGSGESEHEIARIFSAHLGTEHYEKILTPDSSAFLQTIGEILDEPNGDSSCLPTYLLSEFARKHVTVAISGDGGDELFAGYGRFMSTIQEFDGANENASRSTGEAYYSDRILVAPGAHIVRLFSEVPSGLAAHLSALRSGLDASSQPLHARLRKTDLENYMPGAVLPKMDRMSMRHSLEVRTPFLNRELARFAERLGERALYANGVGKQLLRRVACRYLPAELINMPKRGFAIPTNQWAPAELWSVTRRMLFSEDSRLLDVFGPARLESFVGNEAQFNGSSVYRVWGLVMLESWCRSHKVTLPKLPPTIRQTQADRTAGAATLFARQIAPDCYAATVLSAADEKKAVADLESALHQSEILCLALTQKRLPKANALESDTVVKSLPLTPDETSLSWLKNASLLFINQADLPKLAATEFNVLQTQGVTEMLGLDPYRSDGQVIRIAIRQKGTGLVGWLKRYRLMRTRLMRQALHDSPADGKSLRLVIQSSRAKKLTTHGGNLFASYAVRIDGVQLPPLPRRDDALNILGDGRYHIFGNGVALSLPKTMQGPRTLTISPADPSLDEFHAEEIPAPVTDGGATRRLMNAEQGVVAQSVIDLRGKNGLVVFTGALLPDDLASLTQLVQTHCLGDEPMHLITAVPLSREAVSGLPERVQHLCLYRCGIDKWLRYVPDAESYRSDLWPAWNEYGKEAATLLGYLRMLSPRRIVALGDTAHRYMSRLREAGSLTQH
ncbi:asparagine synthase (glutamine-hydrolyzing) [Uliginosibacterium sp. H3]|uniref:asparagine synthase (glutamine-hydrolyzing) n=1 Tax=Uliginosibacterium silvisoli TaxID=3114758 RepID=A0ABU6K2E6_9RHOO|nr:asparagine synthase (glutamine-hydrolyzing) [Uliginosibacterium sp. H3]